MSKRKKVKLPKRIAGVKLPKATRKGPIVDFLNSSGGQVLLAEALVLAAGVFGARRVAAQAGAPWDPGTRENIARENIADASARLAHASREALKAFRAALSEPSPLLELLPASADELVRKTGLGAGEVARALVELELEGRVAVSDGVYRRAS